MAADTPVVVALAQPVAVVVEPTRVAGVAIAAGGQGPAGIPGPVGPAGPAGLTRDTFLTYPFGEGNGVYFNDLQLGEVLSLPHLTPVAPGVQSRLYHPQASLTQSGAGAGLETLGMPISMQLTTGSTTAGQAALSLHSLEPNQVWRPGTTDGWSAFAVVSLSALSSTYERFAAVLTLFTLSAGGLYCSYSDNLNGGRWRLAYQDAAYKTVYVDTGITPVPGEPITLQARCLPEGAGVYRLQVTLGGVRFIDTTDLYYSQVRASSIVVGNSFRLFKSSGWAPRQMAILRSGLRVRRS
ncbi:hypothetical protein [Metapseudomonas otitidis]|uniref:hypothetical protein n=1 Tax=Metapseudomonas otitidis TaxID=319939 RepID=UPI0013F68354|nr:hypothetical protein [Pseudomonas otitidis]